jgi:hypothetical protein
MGSLFAKTASPSTQEASSINWVRPIAINKALWCWVSNIFNEGRENILPVAVYQFLFGVPQCCCHTSPRLRKCLFWIMHHHGSGYLLSQDPDRFQ